MKTLITLLTIILLFAALGAAFYYGFYGISYAAEVFFAQEALVQIILLVSSLTVLVASLFISSAIKTAGQARGRAQLFDKKLNLYLEVLKSHNAVMTVSGKQSSGEWHSTQQRLGLELNLVADRSVINAYTLLNRAVEEALDEQQLMERYNQLVVCMRKDLGHTDRANLKLGSFSTFKNTEDLAFKS